MPDLTAQVIAITGASSGIGAATALACARAGMDVVLGARRMDKLEAVAAEVRALGRRAVAIPCDVDRDADVEALIAAAMSNFHRLDAAFANAGYGLNQPVLQTNDAQTRAMFETNFYGTLRVLRAAAPVMRQAGHGRLLICSSAVSEIAPPGYGVYAATKAAQDAVACAMRAELADQNIFVTSIHPVGTATEFLDRVSREAGRTMASNTPGRWQQTSEQVARAIVRCLRQSRPAPEIWPMPLARYVLALSVALPRLTAAAMRRRQRARAISQPSRQDSRP